MYQSERVLVKVATAEGHGAFWLHELAHIVDSDKGCRVFLQPNSELKYRYIDSAWSTERVMKAIEDLTGPPNTIMQKVQQGSDGVWRDVNTGVKVTF